MFQISTSDLESKRFAMNILRVNCENIDLKLLNKEIINNKADIVILRLPSSNSDQIQSLERLGYEFFQTDTLVYYQTDFSSYSPKELRNNDLEFVEATKNDESILHELVFKIFSNYTNHYFSNKYLEKNGILEGYSQWVKNFLSDDTKKVFLVKRKDEMIGFATCALDKDVAEGVLYGILPEFSGGGVYSDVIRYTQEYYRKNGAKKMKVSTQVQNYAVQKVWSREGFYMYESFATIHINPLLTYSVNTTKTFVLKVDESQINEMGRVSQDFNPIHFQDDSAINCGFKGRIAHGLIAEGEISRILGMEYPGPGTIFMNNTNIFLGPIYPAETYSLIVTTPFHVKEKDIYLCVVKMVNQNNEIVLISYNNVVKK